MALLVSESPNWTRCLSNSSWSVISKIKLSIVLGEGMVFSSSRCSYPFSACSRWWLRRVFSAS